MKSKKDLQIFGFKTKMQLNNKLRAEVRRMFKAGFEVEEISAELGVSRDSVRSYLKLGYNSSTVDIDNDEDNEDLI